MNDFLAELEQIQQSSGAIAPTATETTNTAITNPQEPQNWYATAAEVQDYQALNNEIEGNRKLSKLVTIAGAGFTAIGLNGALGNAVLLATHNPTGYLIFTGVMSAGIIAAGLNGSRVEGRKFYSSAGFLSSISAAAGCMGGGMAIAQPYFANANIAGKARTEFKVEISKIENKPSGNWTPSPQIVGLVVAGLLLAVAFVKKR